MRRMFIASSSKVYGSDFLEYLLPELDLLFKDASSIVFVPYARPNGVSYDEYTEKARKSFDTIQKKVIGIHTASCTKKAIENAEAIFIGGGNTFELLSKLYEEDLLSVLKQAIDKGTPYLGCSAGSNICGKDIKTTNDMPIVYPPSFSALQILPFNVNPHYIEPEVNSTHMGETRETRIKEFHVYNDHSVLGLKEGSWLEVTGNDIVLRGNLSAPWFTKQNNPIDISPNSNIIDYL